MKLRETLAKVPDPRAHNWRRHLLRGLPALILVTFQTVFPIGKPWEKLYRAHILD